MSRTVEISLPAEKREQIVPKIQEINGLIGLRIQEDISVSPKGDVLSFEVNNDAVSDLMILLQEEGVLWNDKISMTMTRPVSVISKEKSEKILGEGSESSWEEILTSLNHESNMAPNGLGLMFAAGVIAVIGISTNTLHTVIGAMLIAPGFKPISRIAFGLATSHIDWKHGLKDTLKGYAFLILGALFGAIILELMGKDLIPGAGTYLPQGALIGYWTSITATSVLVSIAASLAGGLIIMTNKSVLTAGVMTALALIPAACIISMALVEGNLQMALHSFLRLLLEMMIVWVFSGLVFLWKRKMVHRRKMEA